MVHQLFAQLFHWSWLRLRWQRVLEIAFDARRAPSFQNQQVRGRQLLDAGKSCPRRWHVLICQVLIDGFEVRHSWYARPSQDPLDLTGEQKRAVLIGEVQWLLADAVPVEHQPVLV